MSHIAIDLRMWNNSGIGTYLQQMVPRVVGSTAFTSTTLIRRSNEHLPAFSVACEHILFDAPLHSSQEQLRYPRLGSRLLWCPNYNVPLRHRGPLAVTIQDVNHLSFEKNLAKRAYARFLLEYAMRKASAIFFISQFTRSEFERFMGPTGSRGHVTPLAVDDVWFQPVSAASPHPRPFIFAVGNVKPHKNLKRLLSAFRSLEDLIPHDLLIIGKRDGFITGDPEFLAEAKEAGNRVHFTGWIDEVTLRSYFSHAAALVFPSLYEGFGLPPLEAMAIGCPVATSNAASIPEVCGDAALYFDPYSSDDMADKLRMLLTDSQLRTSLIAAGKQRARLFRWDSCAAQTLPVLQQIAI